LRLVRVAVGVVSTASSGRVHGTYIGTVQEGLVARGGTTTTPAEVRFDGNRVSDYVVGAVALIGANPGGDDLAADLSDNEFVTTFANTGPSNPFGVRINAVLGGPPNVHGKIAATLEDNRFLGSHRYSIIVSGGNVLRQAGGVIDTRAYAATLALNFAGNFIDRGSVTANPAIITFTNSRATELPCELDPANVGETCPRVQGGRYWKYLQDSAFDLVHEGELDDAWIDHPAIDPVDRRVLDNVLTINGEVHPHETFVVVP
jgi:hypothetical protein